MTILGPFIIFSKKAGQDVSKAMSPSFVNNFLGKRRQISVAEAPEKQIYIK